MLRIIGRWTLRTIAVLAGATVLLFLGDWAAYKLRGSPQSSVQVNRMLVVPLNNGKSEYDYEGTFNEACSVSLFPQDGVNACWWLRRHMNQNVNI